MKLNLNNIESLIGKEHYAMLQTTALIKGITEEEMLCIMCSSYWRKMRAVMDAYEDDVRRGEDV